MLRATPRYELLKITPPRFMSLAGRLAYYYHAQRLSAASGKQRE